jgi:signal transduction histidine kinase
VKVDDRARIQLGGKNAFNWKLFAAILPFIVFEPPVTESQFNLDWTFWRWTLATMISIIPVIILFALGDFYFFAWRYKSPVKDWVIFLYGFILGATFGASLGFVTYLFKVQNEYLLLQILERALSYGLMGALLLPFASLLTSSVDVYNKDREALIAERMLVESQKAESRAVINSLRSSLSHKVDENLLEIIENSREYFDSRKRTLEENWELLAERLRRAALDTIRPFSHTLHRRGEEITYRVRFSELASYIAYKFDIHIWLTLLTYVVTTHHSLITAEVNSINFKILGVRVVVLMGLLILLKVFSKLPFFHKIYGFTALILVNSFAFVFITDWLFAKFSLHGPTSSSNSIDAFLVAVLIVLISLGMAFLRGGHAEIEFLERRISEEQLETMLLRREEARISRELAKYLHGTIQSRLMASAIGLESAGRRGDVKALKKEAKSAYKNLKLPSESYFSTPENDLRDELDKVIKKWNGLINIKLTLPKSHPDLAPDLIQDVGNVINEGLSNAFRHGLADQAKVKVSFKSGLMIIEIDDNGTGPTEGKGGLGAEWFNAIAGANWNLEANAKQGATLTLEILVR